MLAWILSFALSLGAEPPAAYSDFSGGLNTWRNSVILEENESPLLQNVLFDKTGALTRRQGFSKKNQTQLGTSGADDVQAVYQLEQSDGDRYCVAFSSQTGYYSTDACATFTAFVSTLTRNNNVNCDAAQDRLYCVNNQYNFYFDGTNDVPVAAMPAGLKYIRTYRNRCFALNSTANPSRLFWSALGNCNSWDTTNDWVDVAPEDGDVGTGIGEPLFDMLPVYKKYSTWALKGATPQTFTLVNISKNTGALNHRSIATLKNAQLFDSVGPNGGQPGIYAFNGIVVEEASRKLRNDLDQIDTFRSQSNRKSIDTKTDWDAGVFNPYEMSTSRDQGFLQSSYTARTDTTSGDFENGTLGSSLTARAVANAVQISTNAHFILNGDFETGSLSNNWTCIAEGSGCTCDTTASAISGSYSGRLFASCGSPGTNTRVYLLNSVTHSTLTTLMDGDPGDRTITSDITSYSTQSLKIRFYAETTSNKCYLTSDAFTAVSSITWTHTETLACPGTAGFAKIDNIRVNRYFSLLESSTTKVYYGATLDTYISTPIGGPVTVSSSLPTGTSLAFQVRSATSSGGPWTSWTTVTNGDRNLEVGRYYQYLSSFTTNVGTSTPRQNDVTISAVSSGTWKSPELFLSNNISAGGWGLFQTVATITGNAAIAYAVRVATYSGGTADGQYAPYNTVTANAALTISTGAYMRIVSTYTITSASESAKTDAIVINWNEGTQSKSSTGKVFQNRYHYGAQPSNGTTNSVIYVLDQNGAWSKWTGMKARYLNVVNQEFLMADASTATSGYVFKLYDTDSDDGQAIDARWLSKDLFFSGLHNVKSVDRIFVVHASSSTNLTVSLNADAGIRSKTYSVSLSTGAPFGIKQIVVQPPLTGNSFRIGFSNNGASKPWEVLGYILNWRDLGLMQP